MSVEDTYQAMKLAFQFYALQAFGGGKINGFDAKDLIDRLFLPSLSI